MTIQAEQDAIAIVGAGLAGLAAAAALGAQGRSVDLVGPALPRSDTRTTALLDGSVRLLEELGLWETARRKAAPLRVMMIVDATSRLVRAPPVRFEAEAVGIEAFGWNIPNVDLAEALEAFIATLPSVRRRTAKVSGASLGGDDPALTLDDASRIEPRLVVAADGRNSELREAAGIATRTWSYPQVALAVNLRQSRAHDDMSVELHTEAGPITLVPLPGRRSSLVGVVAPEAAETLRALDDEAFALAVERRCHSIYGRFEVDGPRSFWPLSGLSASTQVRGRTVLLGEAAHALAPIGAQGFNLTIRDVEALRDSLAGSEDPGSPAALARYERSRWGDVASRTIAVDALNRSLLSDLLPVQVARALGLYALGRSPHLRRRAIHLGLAPAGHRAS